MKLIIKTLNVPITILDFFRVKYVVFAIWPDNGKQDTLPTIVGLPSKYEEAKRLFNSYKEIYRYRTSYMQTPTYRDALAKVMGITDWREWSEKALKNG